MKYIIFIKIFLLTFFIYGCYLTNNPSRQKYEDFNERNTFRIVFYNTENFFDTKHDSSFNDYEFTPEGKKHWTFTRYKLKLQHISKVLIAAGGWKIPDIIGLAEIENRHVLDDLLEYTPLSCCSIGIIHKESPDPRGIDVGLLYNTKTFKPVYYKFIRINFGPGKTPTRDIIYAKGIVIQTGDTIHVFLNHWPSRSGGRERSDPRRLFTAMVLKHSVDSILKLDSDAKIIIGGDLNDEPSDSSICHVLDAGNDTISNPGKPALYNMMFSMKIAGFGTIKYKYEWSLFDQFIVTKSFFNRQGKIFLTSTDAHIFRSGFILASDQKYGGEKPFQTYSGSKYLGGYSDHLPVYLDLKFRQ